MLGAYIGLFIALVILFVYYITYKSSFFFGYDLDERQRRIQSSVIIHTLIFGFFLLVVSGIMASFNNSLRINVAEQNLIIVFACGTYFVIESIWREVYFGIKMKMSTFWVNLVLFVLYIIIVFLKIQSVFAEAGIILQNGKLTQSGWELLIFTWGAFIFGAVLVGWYRAYKKD